MSAASATANARQAANSSGMDRLARLGLVSRGVIYLVIGVLAVLLAFGKKSGETDQRGAIQQLARQTGGFVLVLIVAVGLVVLRAVATERGRVRRRRRGQQGRSSRAVADPRAGVRLPRRQRVHDPGAGSPEEPGQAAAVVHRAVHALHRPDAGRSGSLGVVIVVVGGVLVYEGVSRKFEKYFKLGEMSPGARKTTEFLGDGRHGRARSRVRCRRRAAGGRGRAVRPEEGTRHRRRAARLA